VEGYTLVQEGHSYIVMPAYVSTIRPYLTLKPRVKEELIFPQVLRMRVVSNTHICFYTFKVAQRCRGALLK